jgi:hypothetical protein
MEYLHQKQHPLLLLLLLLLRRRRVCKSIPILVAI